MIISVYGIPRSGKDTFIEQVINKKEKSIHLQGSKKLNELACQEFNCKFRELSAAQQKEIRILFTKYAKELDKKYELVIVDGHYAFPCDKGYQSVFTQADLDLYDAFFYLKRSGDEIIRNFNSADKRDYSEHLLSKEKVNEWTSFEIDNMKPIVESQDKDFIVLDSDARAVDFVCGFVNTSQSISQAIVNKIVTLAKGKNVVLTDLDKTVSINDLTDDFIEYGKIDAALPKTIFKGDYYTAYQFYAFHNALIKATNYDKAVDYSLKKLIINENVVSDLLALKKTGCVIALTTGMKEAWTIKNKQLQVFDYIFGFDRTDKVIITPLIKKMVSKYLSASFNVIAIGDSVIDMGMIVNATKGYLIAMTKLDKRIIAQHDKGNITKTILQPKYSIYKYDFTEEKELQW